MPEPDTRGTAADAVAPSARPAEPTSGRHRRPADGAAASSAVRATAPAGKRRDIQGLRMLAVVGVLVNHLTDHPQGAFVGVDVFFVISGYLITGLLVRDAGREGMTVGRFFGGFYLRRARRILPAALTVLAASWIAAGLTFKGPRVTEAHTDILYSLGFAANIHYAALGTDYFQLHRALSITQHFWSLAVEEQFYIVWPVVVLVVLTVLGRRRDASVTVLLGAITVLTAASFAYALHDTTHSPATAYFSTFARAWELGIGAVLALVSVRFPQVDRVFGRARGPVMLAGVAAILASFVVVTPGAGFPAPWAALPVLATAVVILVGPAENLFTWPLTNRVSQYLGEISYSLYLWHWPVIVIVSGLLPHRSALYYAIVLALALGLSVLSYQFVETPLRTPRRTRARSPRPLRLRVVSAVVSVALVVAAVVGYQFRPAPLAPDFVGGSAPSASGGIRPGATTAQPSEALRAQIETALQATRFPALDPGLGKLTADTAKQDWAGCNTETTVLDTCTFPSASYRAPAGKTAMLIGDSMALSWIPAFKAALLPQGWKLVVVARQQCTAAYVSWSLRTTAADRSAGCDRFHAFLPQAVQQVDPDLVVLSSTPEILTNMRSGSTGDAADAEYARGLEHTQKIVAAPGRHVVTLSSPPAGKPLVDCDTASATPADCVTSPGPTWLRMAVQDKAVASRTATSYLDSSLWFCAGTGYCPSFVSSTPVFYDGAHLTKDYASSLGTVLAQALLRV